MKGRVWVFLVGISILTCPGVSFAVVDSLPLPPLPVTHTIPNVPFYPQGASRYAPASLASVLSFWGREVGIEEFGRTPNLSAADDPRIEDLDEMELAEGLNLWTYRGSLADLRNHITLNHPVITFLDSRSPTHPNGHFIVVTGFNDQDRKILAHSVSEPNQVVAYDRFVEDWAKADFWTLLILPKELKKKP